MDSRKATRVTVSIIIFSILLARTAFGSTIISCDSAGNPQSTFNISLNESVYAKGFEFPPSSAINVYLVKNRAWVEGDAIPTSGQNYTANQSMSSNEAGSIAPALLYTPVEGDDADYDIIADADWNAVYNATAGDSADTALAEAGVTITILEVIQISLATTNGTLNSSGNFINGINSTFDGGDASISFGNANPGQTASTNGANPTGAGQADGATAGGSNLVDFIVLQNSGNQKVDIAIGTDDPNAAIDENGDGNSTNEFLLFPESTADYSTMDNLFVLTKQEIANSLTKLNTSIGYSVNAKDKTTDADSDGVTENITSAGFAIDNSNWQEAPGAQGGPATGSRLSVAQGLPFQDTQDCIVLHLGFEAPPSARLDNHQTKVIIYVAKDTSAGNDAA